MMEIDKLSAAELSLRLAWQEYEHDAVLDIHAKTALEAAESFKAIALELKRENDKLRRSMQAAKEL